MIQDAGLSVGALLRSRREELGEDTESVSRQLRIRPIYIRAIEDGRIQDLPGTAYAVGFVRTYADFLGFDGNSVVASFRDELGRGGRPETVSWQIEDKDGGFPFGRLLVVLVVIAAAGYGLWYYLANTQSGTGLIEAVPEYLKKSSGTDKAVAPAGSPSSADQAPAGSAEGSAASSGSASETAQPAPATPPGTDSTTGNSSETQPAGAAPTTDQAATDQAATGQAATGQAPAAPASSTPASSNQASGSQASGTQASAGQATPSQAATAQGTTGQGTTSQGTAAQAPSATSSATQATAGQPAAPGSGEAAPGVAAAATSSPTRISIRAKLESWVQINDKDGKPVLSRVLRAGETYAVPDEKGLVMNTGNAGGIEMVVDGKALPSLGSVGLVKRNILLDADKLASGNVQTKAPAKNEPASDGSGGAAPTGD